MNMPKIKFSEETVKALAEQRASVGVNIFVSVVALGAIVGAQVVANLANGKQASTDVNSE